MRKSVAVLVLMLSSPVLAQQVDVPKLMGALQQQRNDALDRQAIAETRAAQLAEELEKVKSQLKAKEDELNKPNEK